MNPVSFPDRDPQHVLDRLAGPYGQWVRVQRPAVDGLAVVGLTRPDPDEGDVHVLADGHLHGDVDQVCPRCLSWIEGRDFVRRTAYGVLQHEVCPTVLTPDRPAR